MNIQSIQSGLERANSASPHANSPAYKQAQELEAVFLNTLVSQMVSSVKSENGFGGGHAEETWRGMQSEMFSKQIAEAGGIGLADQIMRDLLDAQENASLPPSPSSLGAYSS